jgi:hypothetical protein
MTEKRKDTLLRHSGKEILFAFKTTGQNAGEEAAEIRKKARELHMSTSEMVRRALNDKYNLGIQEKDDYHLEKRP